MPSAALWIKVNGYRPTKLKLEKEEEDLADILLTLTSTNQYGIQNQPVGEIRVFLSEEHQAKGEALEDDAEVSSFLEGNSSKTPLVIVTQDFEIAKRQGSSAEIEATPVERKTSESAVKSVGSSPISPPIRSDRISFAASDSSDEALSRKGSTKTSILKSSSQTPTTLPSTPSSSSSTPTMTPRGSHRGSEIISPQRSSEGLPSQSIPDNLSPLTSPTLKASPRTVKTIGIEPEVNFILNILEIANFTLPLWDRLKPFLFESSLSVEDSQRLAKVLFHHSKMEEDGTATLANHAALVAFCEALHSCFEFADTMNHASSVDLNSKLVLQSYLNSPDFKTHVGDASPFYVGIPKSLPSRLRLALSLATSCPSYPIPDFPRVTKLTESLSLLKPGYGTPLAEAFNELREEVRQRSLANGVRCLSEYASQLKAEQERIGALLLKYEEALEERGLPDFLRLIKEEQRTLAAYTHFSQFILEASRFLVDARLSRGFEFLPELREIHRHITHSADKRVDVAIVGLTRTGKSTLVSAIVGEELAPTRELPLTAIPVRYLHDPRAKEPVMLVPFASRLNSVLRTIRTKIKERGKEDLKYSLSRPHLKELVDRIDAGLTFTTVYEGGSPVFAALSTVHDLFRLVAQDVFFEEIGPELPLEWTRSSPVFLGGEEDANANLRFTDEDAENPDELNCADIITVRTRFSEFGLFTGLIRPCIIDTPGLNDEAVTKLNLSSAIHKVVSTCHAVVMTVDPHCYADKDKAGIFKDKVLKVYGQLKIPSLVAATMLDTVGKQGPQLRAALSDFLSLDGRARFPPERIIFVSGRQRLHATHLLTYLDRHNRKPGAESADPLARKLANDWITHVCSGETRDDKREQFEKMPRTGVAKTSASLIELSGTVEPLNLLFQHALTNLVQFNSQLAGAKCHRILSFLDSYLRVVQRASQAPEPAQKLFLGRCNVGAEELTISLKNIRHDAQRKLAELRRDLAGGCKEMLTVYAPNLGAIFRGDFWEFKTRQEAEIKVSESAQTCILEFEELLNAVLVRINMSMEDAFTALQQQLGRDFYQPTNTIMAHAVVGDELLARLKAARELKEQLRLAREKQEREERERAEEAERAAQRAAEEQLGGEKTSLKSGQSHPSLHREQSHPSLHREQSHKSLQAEQSQKSIKAQEEPLQSPLHPHHPPGPEKPKPAAEERPTKAEEEEQPQQGEASGEHKDEVVEEASEGGQEQPPAGEEPKGREEDEGEEGAKKEEAVEGEAAEEEEPNLAFFTFPAHEFAQTNVRFEADHLLLNALVSASDILCTSLKKKTNSSTLSRKIKRRGPLFSVNLEELRELLLEKLKDFHLLISEQAGIEVENLLVGLIEVHYLRNLQKLHQLKDVYLSLKRGGKLLEQATPATLDELIRKGKLVGEEIARDLQE